MLGVRRCLAHVHGNGGMAVVVALVRCLDANQGLAPIAGFQYLLYRRRVAGENRGQQSWLIEVAVKGLYRQDIKSAASKPPCNSLPPIRRAVEVTVRCDHQPISSSRTGQNGRLVPCLEVPECDVARALNQKTSIGAECEGNLAVDAGCRVQSAGQAVQQRPGAGIPDGNSRTIARSARGQVMTIGAELQRGHAVALVLDRDGVWRSANWWPAAASGKNSHLLTEGRVPYMDYSVIAATNH